jgi:hypothetical protein
MEPDYATYSGEKGGRPKRTHSTGGSFTQLYELAGKFSQLYKKSYKIGLVKLFKVCILYFGG